MAIASGIGLAVFSYLLGSITTAIMVCHVYQLTNPYQVGSGNPGATNMLRTHGKLPALLTFLGDILKGYVPVMVAMILQQPSIVIAICMVMVLLGHIYPLYFGFKGGKGIATLVGVLLALYWLLGLVYMLTWVVVVVASRYVSAASIVATLLTPVVAFWLLPNPVYIGTLAGIALLLVWRHWDNIKRLMASKEYKIKLGRS